MPIHLHDKPVEYRLPSTNKKRGGGEKIRKPSQSHRGSDPGLETYLNLAAIVFPCSAMHLKELGKGAQLDWLVGKQSQGVQTKFGY